MPRFCVKYPVLAALGRVSELKILHKQATKSSLSREMKKYNSRFLTPFYQCVFTQAQLFLCSDHPALNFTRRKQMGKSNSGGICLLSLQSSELVLLRFHPAECYQEEPQPLPAAGRTRQPDMAPAPTPAPGPWCLTEEPRTSNISSPAALGG